MDMNKTVKIPALLKSELLTACLWGLFLAGVLIGAAQGEGLGIGDFVQMRREGDWKGVFLRTAASSLGMLAAVFLSGFSAAGGPFAAGILLLRGMGIGGCAGELYRQMGFSGAAAAFVLLILPELPGVYCFLLGSRSAVRLSGRLAGAMVSREPVALSPAVKHYCVRFLLLGLLLICSAGVGALCTGLFGRLIL